MGQGSAKESIMKVLNKQLAAIVLSVMACGLAQAGDMDGAVAYSLGEFDRVGTSQPLPKAQAGARAAAKRQSPPDAAQERQLAARKAEFVRRMFWLALSSR
jgi:hypothetical protein